MQIILKINIYFTTTIAFISWASAHRWLVYTNISVNHIQKLPLC